MTPLLRQKLTSLWSVPSYMDVSSRSPPFRAIVVSLEGKAVSLGLKASRYIREEGNDTHYIINELRVFVTMKAYGGS